MRLAGDAMSLGRVDEVAGQAITTRFLRIGFLPVLPVGSELCGFPIPLHAKSVIAAYVRAYAPLLSVLALALGRWEPALALAIVWATSFGWGVASRRTRALRTALGEV